MKRISNVKTLFLKKIIPIILLINILIIIFCFTFFNYTFKNLFLLIGATIIFSFGWISSFRRLKVVYLGNKYLEVDSEKIFFEKIISIEKTHLYYYKVTYELNNTIESFMFMPIVPLIVPDYVKEIREFIEKNRQKTTN